MQQVQEEEGKREKEKEAEEEEKEEAICSWPVGGLSGLGAGAFAHASSCGLVWRAGSVASSVGLGGPGELALPSWKGLHLLKRTLTTRGRRRTRTRSGCLWLWVVSAVTGSKRICEAEGRRRTNVTPEEPVTGLPGSFEVVLAGVFL